MSDELMLAEYPDQQQRAAVCSRIWEQTAARQSHHAAAGLLYEGRISLPWAEGLVPDWIMWMPGGVHEIAAHRAGKPWRGRIHVGPEDAEVVQAALAELLRGRQRPYIDFDHSGGAAAGWPVEAAWREQPEPGIYIRVEWSAAGREAILGRTYRAFSPRWYAREDPDGTVHVAGLPLNVGGLVNDPAFTSIQPIWTSRATQDPSMTTNTELAALQARIAELEAQKQELEARLQSDETRAALEAAQAELNTTRDRLTKLEQELEARKRRDADACIQAAIARGAIAPKDEASIERWRKLILEDPANADLLARLPGRPALQAGRSTTTTAPQAAGRPRIEIVTPDISDVFRGYISASTPRDRGWIYHKEIKPLLDKGERIPWERHPVEAANVLGTLVGNIIAQRILDLVVSRRPMLRNVTTDFSDQPARKGQTIYTRAVGLPQVVDFGSTTASDTADTDYTVALDQHKQVQYSFTAAEYLGTARDLVAEHAEAQAVAIGNALVDAVAALITTAYTSAITQAPAGASFSTVTAAAKALNTAGAPDFGRYGWINSDLAEALANDQVVMEYLDGDNRSAYGRWSRIKGFEEIWEYPALPTTGNLVGFFFQRSALLLVTRVADDPATLVGAGYPGQLQVITDPVSGLSVLSDRWVSQQTRAINMRLDVLYGVARGILNCGVRIVSA